ncbi:uncharacterized protein [Panulirus ornatus]|uniref:uncharacterized protein n=1 Tax=Panulirus ornatus TaxID=150431 RepID=UPI003A87827B
MNDEELRTVWVGNFDPEKVTQDLLYELFVQAGPLHHVKIAKDRLSGRLKNFAFVCFRHDVSVPYAIELLNGISLFNRHLKVQSRTNQQQQQQSLITGPVGIHTLNPFSPPNTDSREPHQCGRQSNMESVQAHHGHGQQSLLGASQSLMGVPGSIPSHVIELAKQQIALLAANEPVLLSADPFLNAPRQRTSDRFGSVNYDRNYPNQRDDYYQRHSRSGGQRSVDNQTMQAVKARFDRQSEDNSKMLTDLQHRRGHFDRSRLGPPRNDYNSRQNTEWYANNPRHQRYNDNYYRSHGHNDRSNHYRYGPYERSSRR